MRGKQSHITKKQNDLEIRAPPLLGGPGMQIRGALNNGNLEYRFEAMLGEVETRDPRKEQTS